MDVYKAFFIVVYLFNLGLYSVCPSLSPQAKSTMQIASFKYAQHTKLSLLCTNLCGHQNDTTWEKKCFIELFIKMKIKVVSLAIR